MLQVHAPSNVSDTGVPGHLNRCATEHGGHSHFLELSLEVTQDRVNITNGVFRILTAGELEVSPQMETLKNILWFLSY